MRHFFIKKSSIKDNTAVIDGSEARHILRVLRRGAGDSLYLLDEDGGEYQAVITAHTSQQVEVRLLEKLPPRELSSTRVILAQAVPKAQKMDHIVQKATELGVDSVIPFFSSRTGPRLSDDRLQKKCHRWQKIALESTKQCGRKDVATVEPIVRVEEIIEKRYNNILKIILWEDEKNRRLQDVLQNGKQCRNIMLLIGPEGGFTAEEVSLAKEGGFLSVSLGRNILRTETVSLYLLSILHYEREKMSHSP